MVNLDGKGKAFISDPTANEAVSNITPLNSVVIEIDNKIIKIKKPEKWLELARAVFEHFCKTLLLFQQKYQDDIIL